MTFSIDFDRYVDCQCNHFNSFIILLGFVCRKRDFSESVGKILSKVVLTVALPALAFRAFMQDINTELLMQGINVLIWGLVIYIILILVSKPFS